MSRPYLPLVKTGMGFVRRWFESLSDRGPSSEPALQGLVEPLDLPLRLWIAGRSVLLSDPEDREQGFERVAAAGRSGWCRRFRYRSGRTQAKRVLALGGHQHSRIGHVAAGGASDGDESLPEGATHLANDAGLRRYLGAASHQAIHIAATSSSPLST
jgi:hypothetical protein